MRRHLRPCCGPWHVDETYIRVNGQWRYLYRAVDGTGQTIDFLLSAKQGKKGARRFFKRALGREMVDLGRTEYRTLEEAKPKLLEVQEANLQAQTVLGGHPGPGKLN